MKETRVELHFYYNREAGFIYKMNKKKRKRVGVWFIAPIRRQGLFHPKKKKEKEQ